MTGRLLSAKIMLNLSIPKPHAKVAYFSLNYMIPSLMTEIFFFEEPAQVDPV